MEPAQSKATLSAAAVAALHQGNKVEAIKLVRAERGIGLKEAKDLVDAYLESNLAVKASYAATSAQSARKGLWWLAVIIAGAILAYILLTKH